MGTNYYLEKECCPHCGRSGERLHIGKSSAGWCFSLHIHPEKNIHDLPDWAELWKLPDSKIVDEYGAPHTADEMLLVVLARYGRAKHGDHDAHWISKNHGAIGPWGLARHQIDGRHCSGHGVGTYDLMLGDFS